MSSVLVVVEKFHTVTEKMGGTEMTDKKFTDEEIKKALGVCMSPSNCTECPYTNVLKCSIERDCLDLINRQQAEIERLQKHIQEGVDLAKEIPKMISFAQSEAIKEFAERVKDIIDEPLQIEGRIIDRMLDKIDTLVKEMTEGNC